MKKPSIPKAGTPFEKAVKERLEIIGGERDSRIRPLPPDATLDQVVEKINALIALIQ